MRSCILAFILAACGADNTAGARAQCAAGGALNACPTPDATAEGACEYMVECAAIPQAAKGQFDWGNCVNTIEGLTDDRQRLVIDCIIASTCDALQVDGSPDMPNPDDITCFKIGDQ